jgi:hypothetical protein
MSGRGGWKPGHTTSLVANEVLALPHALQLHLYRPLSFPFSIRVPCAVCCCMPVCVWWPPGTGIFGVVVITGMAWS